MKMQHKILLTPIIVMFSIGAASLFFIYSYFANQLQEQTVEQLKSYALVALDAANTVESFEINELQQSSIERQAAIEKHIFESFRIMANDFSKAMKVRLTYIDASGRVLGDSNMSLQQLDYIENHLDRPEISQALKDGLGRSEHYSTILNEDMLYLAVRSNIKINADIDIAHPIIARVSKPIREINQTAVKLRNSLLFIGLVSLIPVFLLSLLGSSLLTKAVAKEQGLLEKRVKHRTNEISTIQTLSSLLNACSNFKEAGEIIAQIVPSLIPNTNGSVSIIKASRNRLDTISHWGEQWLGLEVFAPNDCWALRKGHQHNSDNHGINILCQHWREGIDPEQNTLCIPLLAQGETVGSLHFAVQDKKQIAEYSQLLNTVSEQIGLTLANIQLRDSLREQAIRDPLTNLYNRRYMLESLEQAKGRSERSEESVAILMIDLDHFKRFNDTFGHDAGDHVLKATANSLKASTRQEDIACRFGGEEFCVVCPATNLAQARLVAERIIKAIRSLELDMNKLPLGSVTTSIGIALFPEHGETMDNVIKAADEALYQAKEQGRDRVVAAESLITEIIAQPEIKEQAKPNKEESKKLA